MLQADGYAGFDKVKETGCIREAACRAHVRRKFYDLHVAHHSRVTQEALERIAALYAIEREIRGPAPDERRAIRQSRARPLLESFRPWLESSLTNLSQICAQIFPETPAIKTHRPIMPGPTPPPK